VKRKLLIGIVVIGLMGMAVATAQDDVVTVESEIINAGNVARLGSVEQVDFDTIEEHAFKSGWFALSADGNRLSLEEKFGGGIIVLDLTNTPEAIWKVTDALDIVGDGESAAFIDASFDPSGFRFASLHWGAQKSYITFFNVQSRQSEQVVLDYLPSDMWFDDEYLWTHNASPFDHESPPDPIKLIEFTWPAEDLVRIGRIEPPLAVTATEDGRVKRWNIQTGKVTAEVQIDPEEGLPIYGAVNAGGDEYLVWRDPASMALHLLNFQTGEARTIVQLNGTYIPFIFLSIAADVIIGVNVNDAPIVVAWDVATGQRYNLGEYRECNRPPDMVRLSQDGTTLVIGCDTGLDVWRVQ
jgi:WD40 repeat protein